LKNRIYAPPPDHEKPHSRTRETRFGHYLVNTRRSRLETTAKRN